MTEDFLKLIEEQKRKNLEEMKKVFDVILKLYQFENESRENIFRLSHEYVDFFIEYNDLEISYWNDSYSEIKENARILKKYYLWDEITWKTHKGKKISELIKMNGHYILWAILNLDFFVIDNSFFLLDYIKKYPDYNRAFEINLMKQFVLEKYDDNEFENGENESWENIRLNDGFEGDIDTWNHYNQ